jgi:hypothetical protein
MGQKDKKKRGSGKKSFAVLLKQVGDTSKPNAGLLSFSFKYFSTTDKYSCREQEPSYFHVMLERIKGLSGWTATEFRNDRTRSLRAHEIDWQRESLTERTFGIPQGDEFDDLAYQFALSANEHGRIQGFLIDTVFYVVWLDPYHRLDRGGG